VRPNNDGLETLAGSHQKSGPAVLEPIGSILILEADEVEMRPRWTARAVTDGGQILLIQVLFAGNERYEYSITFPRVSVSRSSSQQKTRAPSSMRPAAVNPNSSFRSVRQCAFPVIAHLAIADESAFVLAEEESVGLRDQFFLHLVDEDIGAREPDILTISRDALVRSPLNAGKRYAPAVPEWTVGAAAIVTELKSG
jgi:hypothetical protein